MRNATKLVFIVALCVILMACGNQLVIYPTADDYIGSWIEVGHDYEISLYAIHEEYELAPIEKEPWQVAFASIVNAFIDFEQSGRNYYDEDLIGDSSVIHAHRDDFLHGSLNYAFHDLSGNGIPELLVKTSEGRLHEIFTIQNGKPIALFQYPLGRSIRNSRLVTVDIHANYIITSFRGGTDWWFSTLSRLNKNGELDFIAQMNAKLGGYPRMFGLEKITYPDNIPNLDTIERVGFTTVEAIEWLSTYGVGIFWPDYSINIGEARHRKPVIDWIPILS